MAAALLFAILRVFERTRAAHLPAHHRLVLIAMADYADDSGKAWPSALTISTTTGQSRSTVELILSELEDAGWIEGERRGNGMRRLSTVYLMRTEGRPVARARPGRHTPRGGVSDTPRGIVSPSSDTPRGGEGTPRGGVPDTPRGDTDTPRGGEDPTIDPTRSDPTKDPPMRAHEAREAYDGTRGDVQQILHLVEPAPMGPADAVWTEYIAGWHSMGKHAAPPRLNEARQKLIKRQLKQYPPDDLIAACRGVFLSQYHVSKGYTSIELALRDAEKIERFRDIGRRGQVVPYEDRPAEGKPATSAQRPAEIGERTWTIGEKI